MIYLDYNSTTPVDDAVVAKMLPCFTTNFGNPSSSSHAAGWTAEAAVKEALGHVADLIGADPADIIFTSGATESINCALKGIARATAGSRHIVTCETEHKAVIETCETLQQEGCDVTILPVDHDGMISLEALADSIRDDTIVVAIMWANNEIGSVAPVEKISEIAHARGVPVFVDATQGVGKLPVSVEHVDMLACSAHKFYGPKGVGALYVRRGRDGVRLKRLIDGGGQQDRRRGGTLNVPAIVGMGEAARVCKEHLDEDYERLSAMRDRLEERVLAECPDVSINAKGVARLPQTCSMTFRGIPATSLMLKIRSLCVSSTSACQSGGVSHVLKAIGLSDADAESTLRISIGRPTTDAEIDEAASVLIAAYKSISETKAVH